MIGYIAPFGSRSGYSQAAADYVLALSDAGVDVAVANIGEAAADDFLVESITHLSGGTDAASVRVVHAPIGAALELDVPGSGPIGLVTTWETDRVPFDVEKSIRDRYQAIAVPSECAAAAFLGPVTVIPHVVRPRRLPCSEGERYTFYSIGSWEYRKNLKGLIAAYVGEFTAADRVELRILTDARCDVAKLRQWVQLGLMVPADELPELSITVGPVPHREVKALHATGDCYVSTSRGEAWNLPLADAVGFGRPAIAPMWGGHMDYYNGLAGYYPMVPCVMTSAVPELTQKVVDGQPALSRVAPYGVDARQLWAEIDGGALRRYMRDAYTQRIGRDEFEHSLDDVAANADMMQPFSAGAVAECLAAWTRGL